MQFEQKTLSEIQWNPFDMIGKQWYLLTAGGLSDYNTMTASWGFMVWPQRPKAQLECTRCFGKRSAKSD